MEWDENFSKTEEIDLQTNNGPRHFDTSADQINWCSRSGCFRVADFIKLLDIWLTRPHNPRNLILHVVWRNDFFDTQCLFVKKIRWGFNEWRPSKYRLKMLFILIIIYLKGFLIANRLLFCSGGAQLRHICSSPIRHSPSLVRFVSIRFFFAIKYFRFIWIASPSLSVVFFHPIRPWNVSQWK